MNPEGGKEKIPPALRRAGSFVDRLNQATVTLRGSFPPIPFSLRWRT